MTASFCAAVSAFLSSASKALISSLSLICSSVRTGACFAALSIDFFSAWITACFSLGVEAFASILLKARISSSIVSGEALFAMRCFFALMTVCFWTSRIAFFSSSDLAEFKAVSRVFISDSNFICSSVLTVAWEGWSIARFSASIIACFSLGVFADCIAVLNSIISASAALGAEE